MTQSQSRVDTLCRYLVQLSRSFGNENKQQARKPSAKRKRLHILYLLNDVLHHTLVRNKDVELVESWAACLPALVASTAAFESCPKHKKKLSDLILLWQERALFLKNDISKLQDALSGTAIVDAGEAARSSTTVKLARHLPYMLPAYHGDQQTPWYDLPAGTWLNHITPNSSRPMRPDEITPVPLVPGPAPKPLIDAVQKLLSEAERMFGKDRTWSDDPHLDMNKLGEVIVLDELTGEVIGGNTYYGWSRSFCEKMKQRRGRDRNVSDPRRSPTRDRSSSRSSSYSPPASKRRRLSRSSSSRTASSRSRSRSRSRIRSRLDNSPRRDRSQSLNRQRSQSPQNQRRWPSKPFAAGTEPLVPHTFQPLQPPIPPQFSSAYNGAVPPPPPRPPNYNGPWPPPPPPLPPPGWTPDPTMLSQMMAGQGMHLPASQQQYGKYHENPGFGGHGRSGTGH